MERFGFNNSNSEENLNYAETKEKVMSSLKDFFKPEFLNRLDDIIVFDILKKEEIKQIVDLELNKISERLSSKNLKLIVTEKAKEFIAESSFDTHYGARPIKRYIQTNLLNELAKVMLDNQDTKETKGTENIVEVNLREEKDSLTKEIKKSISVEVKKIRKQKIVSPIQIKDLKKK
jgi:ATP-dependent Clp protease ATP-binding subunit ClpA